MNGNDFLDKMELIDPAYVEAADEVPKKKRVAWLKWGAVAACLCVAAGIVLAVVPQRGEPQPSEPIHMGTTAAPETEQRTDAPTEPKTETPTERETEATTERNPDTVSLETITIPELYAGFGFEGFAVYDISEYRRGNPWSPDMELTTLPVYRNGAYDASRAGVPRGLSDDEMIALLQEFADRHGMGIYDIEVCWEYAGVERGSAEQELTATKAVAQTDNGTLQCWASGGINYTPAENRSVFPSGSRFTWNNSTDEEAKEALDYLIKTYSDLLAFEKPASYTTVYYNFLGEAFRRYAAYDAAGTAEEVILNYNFYRAEFLPEEYTAELAAEAKAGALQMIKLYDSMCVAEKLGDYPIISADEAKELLLSGYGQSSVPSDYPAPTAETVEHVELIYRRGAMEEVLLPYYRFDVRLPDNPNCGAELGLKNYGVYYVPAIAAEYLTDMPTYNGWFIG